MVIQSSNPQFTPVTSMPEWAKAFTRINPLRYFIEAMRTLYLKGSSLYDLRYPLYSVGFVPK